MSVTLAPALELPIALAPSRVADYAQLFRPRVAVMVLVTVLLGGCLAAVGPVPGTLGVAVLATGLVTAAASALNQAMEVSTDRRMRRTADRPLAAGRLPVREVVAVSVALAVVGLGVLALSQPTLWPFAVCLVTLVSYLGLYTPLKRVTTLNTLVGAVPGALPPLIGWSAVQGGLDGGALALFLVLFFWQVPHFLAIAWMYRDDYARAGLKMLPVTDAAGAATARQMVLYAVALVPISLLPWVDGRVSVGYAVGALVLGGHYLVRSARFARLRTHAAARGVLKSSLVYLPGVLLLWWLAR